MVLILIGMPGCGKSCMGRALSRKLKMKNIDGDRVIEKMTGKRLQEIIDDEGLEGFKKIEEEALLSIKGDNIIISTGGSAVYYESVMNYFKSIGKVVYLYCTLDVLKGRLGNLAQRGVVLKQSQTLEDLYKERCALYEKYADITVDCSGNAYSKYQSRVITAVKYLAQEQ